LPDSARVARHAPGHRWRAAAGVDGLHARVVAHVGGGAAHQHLALVHYRHALGKPQHTVDVVLDDQHRNVQRDGAHQARNAL